MFGPVGPGPIVHSLISKCQKQSYQMLRRGEKIKNLENEYSFCRRRENYEVPSKSPVL